MNNLADPALSVCPELLTYVSERGALFAALRVLPILAQENQELPCFHAISRTLLRLPSTENRQ
jgi:hypothetical protein